VREALQQRGFEQVQSWQDLAGQDRVSGGQWCVSAEKTLADR
jgi:release factor glutamine methyltransferase